MDENILPAELWRKILGFATDLDTIPLRMTPTESVIPPMSRQSLQAKRNLSLVCKSFQGISSEYMYEGIEIMNVKKLELLRKGSLRESFRRHTIFFKLTRMPFADFSAHWVDMCSLIAICTRLKTFHFRCEGNFSLLPSVPIYSIDRLIDALPQTPMYLTWDVGFGYEYLKDGVFHLLVRRKSIRSLKLIDTSTGAMLPETRNAVLRQGPLSAEQLLHVDLPDTAEAVFSEIRRLWRIPNLTHITTKRFSSLDSGILSVTHLLIKNTYSQTTEALDLGEICHTFPNLRELTYSVYTRNNRYEPDKQDMKGAHPTIRTLDVMLWTPEAKDEVQWRHFAIHLQRIPVTALPMLRLLIIRTHETQRRIMGVGKIKEVLADVTIFFEQRAVEVRVMV